MLQRQTSGSVVCPSCGRLVGVAERVCPHCGRRNPGMWGFAPLLRRWGGDLPVPQLLIGGCVFLYLVSLLLEPSAVFRQGGALSFLAPSNRSLQLLGASGAVPVVLRGHWWTLLSAGWLHGGLLHILFNMLWVRQLAPMAVALFGSGRALILYVVSSASGFLLSSLGGAFLPLFSPLMGRAFFTVGASAAIFGLLGGIVYAGRRGIAAHVGRQAWFYAVILFIFGITLPAVDNWAHLGGFLGGYLAARWLNPLRPERPDHLIGALAALALTVLAVLASLVQGLGG